MKISYIAMSIILPALLIASSDTDSLFEMSLEELMNIEIKGSTKTSMTKLNVPSSVTVFTHKEIQNMGVSTLEGLKNFVPGFQSRQAPSASTTNATVTRGHQSGTTSKDILILVDGQRLNMDVYGGTGEQTPMIALENVQKVEFIRGAGSALYGSNAFSAVISITTINDRNEFSVRGGEYSLKATALVSVKEDDYKLSAFVKVVKDNGDKYHDLYSKSTNSITDANDPYSSIDLYLQALYEDFSIYLSHSSRKTEDFYMLKILDNNSEKNTETSYIRGTYDFEYKNFNSQVAVSFMEGINDIDSLVINPTVHGSSKIKEQTPAIEYFGDYKINDEHSLQFGAEYRRPKVIDATVRYNLPIYGTSTSPNYTYPLIDEDSRDIIGVYAQYQGEIYKDLHLTLGVRHDDYSDFGSSTNPRSALVYNVSESTSVKVLYSSAYRAPTRIELDTRNNGVVSGNQDLDAEEIDSYEFIISHEFSNQILNISLYRNELKNIIVPKGTTFKNAGNGSHKGLELDYEAVFFDTLSTRLTYTHLIDQPDEGFRTSDNLASAIINYKFKKFNFNVNGYFNDSVENNFNGVKEKIDSYIITNAKVTYAFTKNLNFYLQANNLFDVTYYAPTLNTIDTINLPNRGIEGFVGLEYSF